MSPSGPQRTVVLSAYEIEFVDEGDDIDEDAPTESWSRNAPESEALVVEEPWWRAARRGLRASSPSADTQKREARMSWWEAARLGLRANGDG